VNENRAASAGDTGPEVMIDLDENVVQIIIAPKPVA
jgi:hypothetical protein